MAWGREPGRTLLDANPELQLHHMHDANQDRLMIQRMTYFRVKRRSLGARYTRFLEERLRPGGTIFVVECERRWPVVTVGPRHYFQPGAMGGLEPEDYLHGSPRVADYLARYGSTRRRWEPPPTDDEQPEAEWGFEPALRDDLEALAAGRGYRLRRIVFRDPEDLSPLVADLHRWWYARRGLESRRLPRRLGIGRPDHAAALGTARLRVIARRPTRGARWRRPLNPWPAPARAGPHDRRLSERAGLIGRARGDIGRHIRSDRHAIPLEPVRYRSACTVQVPQAGGSSMTIPPPPESEIPERREPGIDIPPEGPTPDLPPPEFPETNEPDYRAPGMEDQPVDLPREEPDVRTDA